jgi:hypothetical protein
VKRPTGQTRLRDTVVHLRHAEAALDQALLEPAAPEAHAATKQLRAQVEVVRRRAQRALTHRRTTAA